MKTIKKISSVLVILTLYMIGLSACSNERQECVNLKKDLLDNVDADRTIDNYRIDWGAEPFEECPTAKIIYDSIVKQVVIAEKKLQEEKATKLAQKQKNSSIRHLRFTQARDTIMYRIHSSRNIESFIKITSEGENIVVNKAIYVLDTGESVFYESDMTAIVIRTKDKQETYTIYLKLSYEDPKIYYYIGEKRMRKCVSCASTEIPQDIIIQLLDKIIEN